MPNYPETQVSLQRVPDTVASFRNSMTNEEGDRLIFSYEK
jgi:hypothetical protein